MAEELVMPRLSDTMESGTIARWLVKEGDAVAEGDILAEIETDKALMELQSYASGTLLRIIVADGESAPLGAPIALVGEQGEDVSGWEPEGDASADGGPNGSSAAAAPPAEQDEQPAERVPAAAAAPTQSAGGGGDLKASPVARRLAAEHGLDLRPLAGKGSGPDGRIVRVDVERLVEGGGAPAPAAAPAARQAPATAIPEGERVEASSMLKAVARRMAESKSTVPHFYLDVEIDMTRAVSLRAELNEALQASGEKVSFNDLVIRGVALALVRTPQLHRSWDDGTFVMHASANIGVAVALDEGLVVPVLRGVEGLSVRDIAVGVRDLASRARENRLKQSEIEGGTFTVSNLGMFGVERFGAVINPGEPGILAVGAVEDRVVAVDGAPAVRPRMTVTLSVDHRASSGADGARFLAELKRLLESPVLLLA